MDTALLLALGFELDYSSEDTVEENSHKAIEAIMNNGLYEDADPLFDDAALYNYEDYAENF